MADVEALVGLGSIKVILFILAVTVGFIVWEWDVRLTLLCPLLDVSLALSFGMLYSVG